MNNPDPVKINRTTMLSLLALLLLCLAGRTTAQSFCPNSNFSAGNFSNWDGYYGDFDNPEIVHGFVLGSRHVIIQSPAAEDPNTCDSLLTLPAGEPFCARLGNDDVNSEAEELRYTFTVSDDNNLFIYKYAVVLEDPGHNPDEQPSFTIEVKNQNGQLFDPVCGYYYVYAHTGIPGWHFYQEREVVWKDWTTVGLDLSSQLGQTVTIVFTTRDCSLGAHFGYAYISTHCDKLQLTVGFCLQNSTVTVTAPPGFSYLWNTGETTQSILIVNPTPGLVESCRLTAVNGCQVTIQATIQPTILMADFDFETKCAEVPITFMDKSSINQNSIVDWVWDFGDGTSQVSGDPDPVHTYANPGNYNVRLIVHSTDPCTDTITKPITILPHVSVNLGKDLTLSWHETVFFDAGNPGATYLWSTGQSSQTITTGGEQTLWVVVQNAFCMSTDTVVIHELPRCICEVPNAFSPNGDGENDMLYIYGSGFESFEFLLFDRSGELVFKSVNPGDGWDGSFKGQKQGMAVYNYILRVVCVDGSRFFRKGNITLLK